MDKTNPDEQFDEELYTKRLEEGYDIFDEKYVRWLLLKHPDKVHSDWLENMPSSSKQSSNVILNYSNVYEALNRKRKHQRPVVLGPPVLDKQKNYISKYLIQEVTVPKQKTKQVRVSGARVLTSDECMKIVQEREDAKKEKALQMQKRKEEREAKKRKQETSKEGKSKQNKGTPKGKGKQKAKVNVSETMDVNKCPICDMKWEDDDGENGEWLGCGCGQWLHEECIDYDFENPHLICPNCIS